MDWHGGTYVMHGLAKILHENSNFIGTPPQGANWVIKNTLTPTTRV
jgi:hypothetical protein